MAPFQTNKDLISTGIKEFNVLLEQQVSSALYFKVRDGESMLEGQRRFI